jgi:hypothetical protein
MSDSGVGIDIYADACQLKNPMRISVVIDPLPIPIWVAPWA